MDTDRTLWTLTCGTRTGLCGLLPEGHRLDFVKLDFSLENLLNLAFFRALLNFFSSNQIQEFRRQDQVLFNGLKNTIMIIHTP